MERTRYGNGPLFGIRHQEIKLLSASKHIKKSLESKIDINGYWSLYLFPFVQISSTEGLSYSVQFFDPGESSLIEKLKLKLLYILQL